MRIRSGPLVSGSPGPDRRDRDRAALDAARSDLEDLVGAWKRAKDRVRKRPGVLLAAVRVTPIRREGSRESPYRGVSWNRRDRLWVARVKVREPGVGRGEDGRLPDHRSVVVGTFAADQAELAARCYDREVRRLVAIGWVRRPVLNFPDDDDPPPETVAERAKARLLEVARDFLLRTGREPLALELARMAGLARNRACRWIRELKASGEWSRGISFLDA